MNNFPNRIGIELSNNQQIMDFIQNPKRNFTEKQEIENRVYTEKPSHELIADNINNIDIKTKNNFAKFNYTFKKSYTYYFLKRNAKKILKKLFNYKFPENSSRYIKFYQDFKLENLEEILNNVKNKKINQEYDNFKIKLINDSIFEIK